ncbi:unnamed protein product, partial [Ixodes hexagonus]
MSSYFANSYLPDMRPAAGVGNGDHYGPPPHHQQQQSQQQPNGDHCGDQRQYLPYGGSPGHQGYPRFPPYDRLEIRAISSAPDSPSPPSGYYGNHCGAPPTAPPPPPTSVALQQQPPQAMSHPNAYVPAPVEAPNCRGSPSEAPVPPAMAQYPSCKMQTGHLAGDVHGVGGRGGSGAGDCGSAAVMHGGACGSPPGVHSPPLQQQQLYSPGHGAMPPNGQQPPTHNSGAMPSPLYPWMRSQF